MSVPGWLRRGGRLDRWYHRSLRHRVVFVSGVIGAFAFVTALFGGEGIVSALAEGLVGFLVMLLILVVALLVAGGWRRIRGGAQVS